MRQHLRTTKCFFFRFKCNWWLKFLLLLLFSASWCSQGISHQIPSFRSSCLSSTLSSPFLLAQISVPVIQRPSFPLLSGLNLMPPATDDSLCCYVEEEKEEEERWRRCGEGGNLFVLFSPDYFPSRLNLYEKEKKINFSPLFCQYSFISLLRA